MPSRSIAHREAIGIIREKALAYQASWRDSSFYARYGKFPLPLWLVPGQRRLEMIGAAWQDAWPEGRWLIATEEGLRRRPGRGMAGWHASNTRATGGMGA